MADADPLSEIFTLFAAPIAGTVKSIEQFRRGTDEFLRGVENFNRTMENLNETAERINALLADVEEPIRVAVPQVTRTVKAADEMMQVVSGPAMAVAPGLTRLADALSTPGFQQLPNQVGQLTELLGEMTRRLAPLGQMAESAGGLFGLRLPGMGGGRPAPSDAPVAESTRGSAEEWPAPEPTVRIRTKRVATAATRKTTATKKTAAKKKPAAKKKAAARKKSAAKKKPAASQDRPD